MIIPLPKSSSEQATPAQAQFNGASKVTQSRVTLSGIQAPQAIQVDPRMAQYNGAALQAYGELGKGIAGKLYEVQMERYEAQNKADLADARLAMDNAYAQFENDKLTNNLDPREWDQVWKVRMDTLHASFAADEKYSPVARAALQTELKDWRGRSLIRVNSDATKATFQRARESENADYLRLTGDGRYDEARALIESSKYIPADDKVSMSLQIRDKQKSVEQQALIDGKVNEMSVDPRGWLERNKDYTPTTADELQQVEWLRNRAQGMIQDDTASATEEVLNSFAEAQQKGYGITDEDIDRLSNGRLSPYAISKFKAERAQMYNAQEQAKRKSPDYQTKLFGQINAAIEDFDPNAPDADDKLVDIMSGIAQSTTMKSELASRLAKKRAGEEDGDDLIKAAERQMKSILLDEKKFTQEVKPSNAALSGLLSDKAKLKISGLSDKQANLVADDMEKYGYSQAMKTYREQAWKAEGKASDGLNTYDRTALEAMKNGTDAVQKVTDDTAKEKAFEAFGKNLKKLHQWKSKNPSDANDETKVKAQMRTIMGDSIIENSGGQSPFSQFDRAAERINEKGTTADGSPGVLPPKTSMNDNVIHFDNPIKFSNYGFASDTTPDSNSAAGIGHSNNKLKDGESVAITASLAQRLKLERGQKMKITTDKGEFVVTYDDTVPSTDKRTGDLPETIDLYRKNGSNDWGGKVYSIAKL